ncbi:TRAP transporter fused permease subunit [Acidobacteria bacterium AH-259-D05]|nr:TRAP transporter fused permease subunit [Acidobacteria bacterium AH-259-D05]
MATNETTPSSSSDGGRLKTFIVFLGISLSVFQVWAVVFSTIDPLLHRAIFLTWILALGFVSYRPYRSDFKEGPAWLDILLAVVSALSGIYYIAHFKRFSLRWPLVESLTGPDLVVGITVTLLVALITRRFIGWPILLIAFTFALYLLGGHLIPGTFSHRYFSFAEFIDVVAYTLDGLMGTPLGVATTYVFMFILFGMVLFHSGGGEFFINLAKALVGGARGGSAKVAVFACGLFGMISGSPTSDAVTTGTFSIPLMKRMGYGATDAGAIVAVAATGGSIMPPVMGSAAFLMAEFTGIPYIEIAIAAIVPAFLYYLGVLTQVHLQALKLNMETPQDEQTPGLRSLLVKNFQFLIPLMVLVVLLIQGMIPTRAAAIATFLTFAVSFIRTETRMGLKKIAAALGDTARGSIVVVSATAAAGIVVGAIGYSGIGGKVTGLMSSLTGESLFLALLLTMVVCILLGMGMPVPSAYVLTAVLTAPALAGLGLPLLAAHLFIVYFSVLSAITPPVAVAAYASAGIAGGNPNQIGFKAVRLGIVAFIVPYIFVYQPSLLLMGRPVEVMVAVLTAAIGVISLAAGLEGWLLARLVHWQRLLLLGGGLMMIIPGIYTDLGGVVFLALILGNQFKQRLGASEKKLSIKA